MMTEAIKSKTSWRTRFFVADRNEFFAQL